MNPCQMPPSFSTVGPTGPLMFPGLYNMTHTNVFALSNDPMTTAPFQDPDASCLSDASFAMTPQVQVSAPSLENSILSSLKTDDEIFSVERDAIVDLGCYEGAHVPEGARCCRCLDPETPEERFLICKDCGLQGIFW